MMSRRAAIDFTSSWFDWFVANPPVNGYVLTGGPNGTLVYATPVAGGSVGGWDYYVYRTGATYYALNNHTGVITNDGDFVTLMLTIMASNISILLAGDTTFSVAAGGLPIYDIDGMRLEGVNEYSTILEAAGVCGTGVVDVRGDNVVLRNFTIDGNAKATTVGLAVGSQGNEARHAYHGTYEALIIKDCTTAGIRSCDDVNYTNFVDIRCADSHTTYGLEFYGDDFSDYNSGQQTFINCVISGPTAAVRRNWTASGTCKGIAFVGCDFQDGHLGDYQVNCTGIYNLLFDRCIFETATNGDAAVSQIKLDSYGVVFNCCSFAFRGLGTTTFFTNDHNYAAAGRGGYVFVGCKTFNYHLNDIVFDIDEGTVVGLSKEDDHAGTTYTAQALAGMHIIGDDHADSGAVNRFVTSLQIPYSASIAASPPTLTYDGEIRIWHDSTNDKEYIMIRSDGETVKIECV